MKLRAPLAALLLITLAWLVSTASAAGVQESFGVKEYDDFHAVLHPLQHEALPKKDFATIRQRAKELVRLGNAIIKVGVPSGVKSERVSDFNKSLSKFSDTLIKFDADAQSASDDQLKTSYTAVHDSFEELAGMLPRKN